MKQRAVLLRAGLAVLVCVGALSATAAELSAPKVAGATPVTSTVYVSNSNASTVTSYPTSANGNTSPIATLSSPSSVNSPQASAFDSSGDLWAANSANNTLVEFTPNQLSSTGSPAPNVTISGTSLDQPDALAFDSSGDLWVADYADSSVVEFTPSQLATNGAPTPNVTLTATASSLDGPVGLAFDTSGDLWVTNFSNSTVVEFTASQLTASGSPPPNVTLSATGASLSEPVGLAFGSSGDLWVTNVGNSTLVEFTPAQLTATGSPTPNVFISSTGTSLDYPYSFAFDSSGDLWVGNFSNNTLVEFTPGQLTTSGSPTPNVTISAGPGGSLDGPVGLIFNSSGDLWAENYNGNTVVEFTATQLAANGSPNPNVTLFAITSLDQPHGLVFDSSGDLWVANYPDSTIIEFTPSQIATGVPTPNVTLTSTAHSLTGPLGLAFDPSGDLWVANFNQNTIAEFTPAQLAASGSPTPSVTLSSTGADSLARPWGLAFDSSGDLWVANGDNNTLVEFTPAQLAASGTPTPSVTLSSTGANSLDDPVGLAFDASGDLWVGNASSSTLVEYTPTELAASGAPSPNITLSATASGSLNGPFGLAFDSSGDLWVANDDNNSVVDFTPGQLSTGSPTPSTTILGAATGLAGPGGIAIAAAPAAPSGVSALAGDTQVTVSWDAVTGAGSYGVFDSASPGGEDYPGAPACTTSSTSCVVGSLTDGATYYFTVEALGPGGTSPPSSEVSATPEAQPTSTTSTTLTATTTTTSTTTTVPTTTSSTTTTTGTPPPPPPPPTSTTTTSVPPPLPPPATIATLTSIRSSANPSAVGAPVTYTARVSPVPNGGNVTFKDNGTTLAGCGAVAVSITTGEATCTVTYGIAGQHTITAAYSGNESYGASVSSPFSQVVGPFPRANVTYPNGAIVSFGRLDYVFAGGRAFTVPRPALDRLRRVDDARVIAAPAGSIAPTGITPRSGTLLSTEAINGQPTIYVVDTSGNLYGFANPAQFRAGGFDWDTVVTVPSLGGFNISGVSAGAADLTALTTSSDGALVNSGGTYYVFAGSKAFVFQDRSAFAATRRADPAMLIFGTVTPAQISALIADGTLLAVGGPHGGVFVSYGGNLYPFRYWAQLYADGYGGTAIIPVPDTDLLRILYQYSGS